MKPEIKIEIVIESYPDHYLGYMDSYDGLSKFSLVQADTVGDCLVELGKTLNVLEIYRKEKNKQRKFKIIVNAREEEWEGNNIKFEELGILAFGGKTFLHQPKITYSSKNDFIYHLFEDNSVEIFDGMVFHVTHSTPV